MRYIYGNDAFNLPDEELVVRAAKTIAAYMLTLRSDAAKRGLKILSVMSIAMSATSGQIFPTANFMIQVDLFSLATVRLNKAEKAGVALPLTGIFQLSI